MQKQDKGYRTVTFLNRDEMDFLDELAKDIYFACGIHIPRGKLIEEIIEEFKEKQALDQKAAEEGLVKRFQQEAHDEKDARINQE